MDFAVYRRHRLFRSTYVTHSQSIFEVPGGALPAVGPLACGRLRFMTALDRGSSAVIG